MVTTIPALRTFMTLDGRLSRHEANTFKLGIYAAAGGLLGLAYLIDALMGAAPDTHMMLVGAAKLAVVMTVVPNIRRLHDRDKSAWWLLLFSGTPWLVVISTLWLLTSLPPNPSMPLALGVSFGALAALAGVSALMLWGAVELTLRPGTDGDNRYGPAPKTFSEPALLRPS